MQVVTITCDMKMRLRRIRDLGEPICYLVTQHLYQTALSCVCHNFCTVSSESDRKYIIGTTATITAVHVV